MKPSILKPKLVSFKTLQHICGFNTGIKEGKFIKCWYRGSDKVDKCLIVRCPVWKDLRKEK